MTYELVYPRLLWNIRRALSWWLEGLRATLPASVITAFAGDQRIVRLRLDSENQLWVAVSGSAQANEHTASLVVDEQRGNTLQEVGYAIDIGRTHPVIVECPPAMVLVRQVTVPVGAIGEINEALRYNLSTWTPFAIDDVYVAAEVVGATEEQAVVELRLVPKPQVKALLNRVAAAGFRLDCLCLGAGALMNINPAKKRRVTRDGKVDAALATFALLLTLMIGATEWHLTESRLEYLQNAISEETKVLKRQKDIEVAIERLEHRSGFVAAKRDSQGSVSEILALLSRALPADADVQEFGWAVEEGRLLILAPLSADPAKHLDASSGVQVKRVETRGRQGGDKTLYEIGFSLRRSPNR